jgi:hypothetical protein
MALRASENKPQALGRRQIAAMWVRVQESQKRNDFSLREQASRHFQRDQTTETITN